MPERLRAFFILASVFAWHISARKFEIFKETLTDYDGSSTFYWGISALLLTLVAIFSKPEKDETTDHGEPNPVDRGLDHDS